MNYTIHPMADVKTKKIGKNTRIWQFVVVMPGAIIGENVNICSHCLIENEVLIENNVTIKSGVFIWDGIKIGEGSFIGPGVAFSNDKYPKSGNKSFKKLETIIGKNVSIGANATILPGLIIGDDAVIGAGSVVTSNVSSGSVVVGNPAKFLKKEI